MHTPQYALYDNDLGQYSASDTGAPLWSFEELRNYALAKWDYDLGYFEEEDKAKVEAMAKKLKTTTSLGTLKEAFDFFQYSIQTQDDFDPKHYIELAIQTMLASIDEYNWHDQDLRHNTLDWIFNFKDKQFHLTLTEEPTD